MDVIDWDKGCHTKEHGQDLEYSFWLNRLSILAAAYIRTTLVSISCEAGRRWTEILLLCNEEDPVSCVLTCWHSWKQDSSAVDLVPWAVFYKLRLTMHVR